MIGVAYAEGLDVMRMLAWLHARTSAEARVDLASHLIDRNFEDNVVIKIRGGIGCSTRCQETIDASRRKCEGFGTCRQSPVA